MNAARPRRLLFLCNALDDATRIERGIATDSPAASRKVFMLLAALRQPGIWPHALSMGRGRRDGSGAHFPATIRRSKRFATLYLPFSNRPLWSELLSLVAPAATVWRLRRSAGRTTLLFYNRERPYLLALLAGHLLGFRMALDLEDGEAGAGGSGRLRRWLFDRLCNGGALVACRRLLDWTALRPAICYYGVVNVVEQSRDWHGPAIGVLLGGTLIEDTGANLLAAAVGHIRTAQPGWASQIEIHVTGKGDALPALVRLAASDLVPRITVHGRTTDTEYAAILDQAHVGLSLKLNGGPLAHSTFPSKVTEMAGAGLLVLATDISDVREVMGDGAVYLERDDPVLLAERLGKIACDRDGASAMAMRGLERAREICAPDAAGRWLADHLFGTRS